jgi:hypothetical protein
VRRRCSLFLERGSPGEQPLQHLLGDAEPRPQPEGIAQGRDREKDLADLGQRDA